ncbi:MAG: MFS transporter [Chlamydiales bacterium]|nr:MFS transporter [Chlamydiales bacterium]
MVKRVLPVYFVVFLGYIGYSLFLTIFAPLFLKGNFGGFEGSTKLIMLGLLIFLYPFGQFLSSPVLGALSDRFGRKPLLLFSLGVACLVYVAVGIGLLFKIIWLIYVALFAAGLSEGNITIAQSAVADVSRKEERHRLFGYIYLAASCSYVVGPVLGGWLANINGAYELPFFIVAGMMAVAFVWTAVSFKETVKKRVKVSYVEGFTNFKNVGNRGFRFWFLVNFLLYLGVFGFLQGYPIFLVARFGMGVGKLSLMITWTDLAFIVVNLFLMGYFGRKFLAQRVLLWMGVLLAAVMGTMILPPYEDAMWGFSIVAGFACAVILPMSSSLISVMARENEQGRMMGVNQSLNFLTEALAGLGFGLLAGAWVKLAMIFFGCMALVAALLLAFKYGRKHERVVHHEQKDSVGH